MFTNLTTIILDLFAKKINFMHFFLEKLSRGDTLLSLVLVQIRALMTIHSWSGPMQALGVNLVRRGTEQP